MLVSDVFLAAGLILLFLAFVSLCFEQDEVKRLLSCLSTLLLLMSLVVHSCESLDEKQKLQKGLKDCQTELEKANEQLNSDYRARVGYANMLKDSVELLELEAKFKSLKAAQK